MNKLPAFLMTSLALLPTNLVAKANVAAEKTVTPLIKASEKDTFTQLPKATLLAGGLYDAAQQGASAIKVVATFSCSKIKPSKTGVPVFIIDRKHSAPAAEFTEAQKSTLLKQCAQQNGTSSFGVGLYQPKSNSLPFNKS
jgi:hypothetical protein